MEFAADTKHIAKYSPTSTPVLDGLRPLPPRRWGRLSAGEYFFLSGAVILGIVAFPMFRTVAESLLPFGIVAASLTACLLIPAAALLVATAAHEAGHILVARLNGFRLTQSRLDSSER